MTVVVTGAAGHLGGALVRALLARDHSVRALVHRDRRALAGLDVEIVGADLADPASLRRAFAGADVVFHAAAHISLSSDDWARLYETNVVGSRRVAEACLACGVRRLVHFSTIHALVQAPFDAPVDEDRPLVPPHPPGILERRRAAPYDCSKAAGELEVRAAIERGLDAVVLYPTAIFGPYDFRPSHFGDVLLRIARGRLPGLVAGGFDWVDVRDVADAALLAMERAAAGSRYLISGHWVSAADIGRAAAALAGVRPPLLISPMWLARAVAPIGEAYAALTHTRPLYTSVSLAALRSNRRISRARASRDLGYAPRPFADTLADTVDWFRQAGMLPRTGGLPGEEEPPDSRDLCQVLEGEG